ncbi:MAG TPA: HD domain-containing protein [Candidatus Colwellbacteria bacterium]|nr:HD domain-containing protein [Candidatus Colwellbacteria bacterium]
MRSFGEVLDKIKEEAKSRLSGTDSCHEWEHTERVYNLAMRIGKKEKADLDVLRLAAFLHDIARKEEDESKGKIDHAERGAILAREILEKHDLSEEKIENIVHCIETHRYRNDRVPQTKEAKILYDADKLDAIGAIGLGRVFSFAGHIGAKVHNKDVDLSTVEPYSIEDTAWREYKIKLQYIKDKMFTDEGKKIAKERHRFMKMFFDRLNKEVDGKM